MKNTYLLSIFSILAISSNCFAMEKELALLDGYIKSFKKLPEEKKVALIATQAFFDGELAQDPEVAAAFRKHPEKQSELRTLAQKLIPQIRDYCWGHFDDNAQNFLARFEKRLKKGRGSMCVYYKNGNIETYMIPGEDCALLKNVSPEHAELLYVYCSILQIDKAQQHVEKKKNPFLQLLRSVGARS